MKRVNGNGNSKGGAVGNRMKTEKKNWNLFAGDSEYKSNFALEFASPFTFDRFKQEKFQRLLFPVKGFICASALFWLLAYTFFGFTSFFTLQTVLGFHIAAFYFARTKYTPLYVRVCFILVEYYLQAASFTYCTGYSIILHFVLFNIPTFVLSIFCSFLRLKLDLLLVYVWYYHLLISLGFTLVRYFLFPTQSFAHTLYEIIAISVLTTVFGFIERTMKEDWVLFDSFRRAQKIYMKLIDQMPVPTFVTDALGRVIYCNAVGRVLYDTAKEVNGSPLQQQRNWNFLELVYAEQKKKVEDMIKRATKETVDPIEVPILTHTPPAEPEEVKKENQPPERKASKVHLGLDVMIVKQGYKYYKIRMERVAWKAANCVMLSCEYTMDYKESFDTLLHNSLQLRTHLQDISSIICGCQSKK